MRYIVTALWAAFFGLLLGYLVAQMTSVAFNPALSALVTVIIAELALITVPALSKDKTADQAK
ncbi:YjzD family protein [Fructobacillus parabroussonetiae]|uniref:YjzD family protein n=1 Tax=Fructobacillus parabroussonetiae TaxID=2713174 RepID=A0ABS5QW98_9LACO|nr:YjzD family protein [Fructobacillus parabroussonetiae]MBS9337483.1 YjzD family protein [Fructobacillus parabroussonetiae]